MDRQSWLKENPMLFKMFIDQMDNRPNTDRCKLISYCTPVFRCRRFQTLHYVNPMWVNHHGWGREDAVSLLPWASTDNQRSLSLSLSIEKNWQFSPQNAVSSFLLQSNLENVRIISAQPLFRSLGAFDYISWSSSRDEVCQVFHFIFFYYGMILG